LALALLLPTLPRAAKPVRFFALALCLGLCPLMLTLPEDRTTIGVSFAGFGWLAAFIVSARDSPRLWLRAGRSLEVLTHVWIALLGFPIALLRARDGWGDRPVGRIMCAERDIPRSGDAPNVLGMQVRVLESTPIGLPARVQFRFASSLDDPARAWLVWRDHAPARWWPPAIAGHARIAGVSLLDAVTLRGAVAPARRTTSAPSRGTKRL
jgi:hypothetical protein